MSEYKPSANWRKIQQKLGQTSRVVKPRHAFNNPEIADKLKEAAEERRVPVVSTILNHSMTCAELLLLSDRELRSGNVSDAPMAQNRPSFSEPGRYLAIDGEFVGTGPNGSVSALGRISVVNYWGNTIYDTYVRPNDYVTDWRTRISGITPGHMKNAISFQQCHDNLIQLLDGKVLIGHSLKNDLRVLDIDHPIENIRDTQQHAAFRVFSGSRSPGLRHLAKDILGVAIQEGTHSSVIDAQAAMLLFRLNRRQFEEASRFKKGRRAYTQERKRNHRSKNRRLRDSEQLL